VDCYQCPSEVAAEQLSEAGIACNLILLDVPGEWGSVCDPPWQLQDRDAGVVAIRV
jgi:hypothetical protein